jgi:hypothetical protein
MTQTDALYDEDFVAWAEQQSAALRAAARTGSNQLLDWDHLAEEIEGLAASQRSALRSQIRRIIRHLVKLQLSHATDPRRGWIESINDAREEIRDLLEDSPSLRREVAALIAGQTSRGIDRAVRDLQDYGEAAAPDLSRAYSARYTEEQVLADWFPEERKP